MYNSRVPIYFVFFLLLLPLLQSCSTSYVYNGLGWLVHWYVDDYVTLTPRQKKSFDQRFAQLQDWHRQTELKRYQLEFERLGKQLENENLKQAEVGESIIFFRNKALEFWWDLISEIEPHLLALNEELSSEQKQQLVENIEQKVRRRYAKKKLMTKAQWQDEKISRFEKSLSPWVGSLTREQETKVRQWAARLNNLDEENLALRLRIVTKINSVLQKPDSSPDGRLAQLIGNPDFLKSSEHVKLVNENRLLTEQLIADVIVTRTAQQDRQMQREVKRWLDRIASARRG